MVGGITRSCAVVSPSSGCTVGICTYLCSTNLCNTQGNASNAKVSGSFALIAALMAAAWALTNRAAAL